MARRVSWTNNSSGHSGTYVYRAPSLDPQNLPAPVATVDPVAQGATAEWVDNSGEYGCFAVQDFDGQGVGTLSAEVCVTDPWSGVQIGDEIEGGIYAGTITYADSRQFHIIFAKQAGESGDVYWSTTQTTVGSTDPDDGMANQNTILSVHGESGAPAAAHCLNYAGGGFNDWYLPAINELLLQDNLFDHPEFTTAKLDDRWSSTEIDSANVNTKNFQGGASNTGGKFGQNPTRPIRRVPV